MYECPYCGNVKPSENGTGSDVACCGERGHAIPVEGDERHDATSSEEIDYDDGLGGYCWRCGGDGFILTCCDDLCHGAGYCMHGDGEEVCPECGGEDAF